MLLVSCKTNGVKCRDESMHGLRVNTGEGKRQRQRQRQGLDDGRVDLPDSSAGDEGEGGPFMVKTVFWALAGRPASPVTPGFAKLSYEQLHFGSSESLQFLHSQWGPVSHTLPPQN